MAFHGDFTPVLAKHTPTVSLQIAALAPQIFISSGLRVLALDQNGTVNSPGNPAAAGSIITVFVTGQGAMIGTAASIGNLPAQLLYAGPAPETAGVAQINMRVPALAPGDYQVQATVGGVASNHGLISVE